MADTTTHISTTATSRGSRILLGALAVLCAGASAAMIGRAAVLFTTPEAAWVAPLPATPASIAETPRPALDTGFDPFHREATPTELPELGIGEDAPETTLDLELKGLRANTDNPSATIKPPSGPDRTFTVGDEVVSGVTLEAVSPRFAVISRSGQLERLSLRDASVLGRPEPPAPPPATNPATNGGAVTRPISGRPASSPPPPVRVQLDRKDPRPLSATSAGDLLQVVSTSIAMVDGRPGGIRVSGRNGADLSQFGLQNGDVITEINGQSLIGAPGGIQGLATTLQQNNSVSVTLLRDGETITTRIGTP